MDANSIQQAAERLFARINIAKAEPGKAEKLDAQEIAQAKAFGFSLFNLTNDMTEEKFVAEYSNVKFNDEQEEKAFEKKEREIHVKYLQLQYGSKTEIGEDETLESFEARLKDEAMNRSVEGMLKEIPGYGKEEPKEEYVKPDETMCRDKNTHDW